MLLRTFFFFLVIAGLIWLGWETPYRDHIYGPLPKPVPRIVRQPPPTGAWMWDPNRHTTLDAPARRDLPAPTPPGNTQSGSWMWERQPMDPPARSTSPHR